MLFLGGIKMFLQYLIDDNHEWLMNEGVKGKIVNTLRMLSLDSRLENQTVYIPDGCEAMGFLEGNYDIASLLSFIADMME